MVSAAPEDVEERAASSSSALSPEKRAELNSYVDLLDSLEFGEREDAFRLLSQDSDVTFEWVDGVLLDPERDDVDLKFAVIQQ